MKKLLLIVPHRPNRSPGQRFRIEQFLPALKEAGYDITNSNIISKKDDKIFYSKGHYLGKFAIVLKSFFHRIKDIERARKSDLVFVYREAYMLGTTIFEKKIAKTGTPMIFDFDDSIWLNDTSEGNKNLAWMKRPEKIAEICKYSTMVTVGNKYLYDYASQYNKNVFIIPTTINTDYHKKRNDTQTHKGICIGWTGTQTTLKHFETIISVLSKLKEKYEDKIYFKVIMDSKTWKSPLASTKIVQWNAQDEIEELCEFDIGIMPLPNDKWSKGKCGFKGLQCMAMCVPVVMSPIGVNSEIIKDGENGFLANDNNEWFDKLSNLIESEELRRSIGLAGHKTVEEKYSVKAWENIVVEKFNFLSERKNNFK